MDFSSANTILWDPIIQLGVISIWFLIIHMITVKCKLFDKFIIPTAMLTGFLLLIFQRAGFIELRTDLLQGIAYQGMIIGTISLALRVPTKGSFATKLYGIRNGAVVVCASMVLALTGAAVTIVFGWTSMPGLLKASGLALPMAFVPGPFQHTIAGGAFQGIGMPLGTFFGSSLSRIAFIISSILGIVLLNVYKLHGKLPVRTEETSYDGNVIDTNLHEKEIPVPKHGDRMMLQAALIFAVYHTAYWVVYFIVFALYVISPAISDAIGSLFWGLHFLIGAILGMALRVALDTLLSINLLKTRPQNNQLLGRIAGAAFDMMMLAGIASMNFDNLLGYQPLFIVMAIAAPFPVLFFLHFVSYKFFKDYACEEFFTLFGALIGSIGTGILLLREVDPEFKTPASANLISGMVHGTLLGFPVLIMASIANNGDIAMYVIVVFYVLYILLLLRMISRIGIRKKR